MAITSFTGGQSWLDNSYEEPLTYNGITYTNAEAAFQAQKTTDKEIKKAFSNMSGEIAKKFGHMLKLPENWEKDKHDIMYRILVAKFQCKYLAHLLIATGDEMLVYTGGDDYWGLSKGHGSNILGEILMLIRSQLINELKDDALKDDFLYKRLSDAYEEHDRLIIAYDIDDTVRPYKSKSCEDVKALIRRAKRILKPYFIVFTANPHKEKNVAFLEAEGLPYDAINENADFIGRYGDGLKVYYNLLLDDKAGLKEAYDALDRLCREHEF